MNITKTAGTAGLILSLAMPSFGQNFDRITEGFNIDNLSDARVHGVGILADVVETYAITKREQLGISKYKLIYDKDGNPIATQSILTMEDIKSEILGKAN